VISVAFNHVFYCIGLLLGNSPFKLRHTRPVAYSVEHVLLNKHLISGGGAYLLPRDHLLLKVQKTSIREMYSSAVSDVFHRVFYCVGLPYSTHAPFVL